jgi:ABC-type spermidine/putrescine transport system permease subunit I
MRNAIKYVEKKERIDRVSLIISIGIMIILLVWALCLAYSLNIERQKILQYVLAIVFSPFYIISYYLTKKE